MSFEKLYAEVAKAQKTVDEWEAKTSAARAEGEELDRTSGAAILENPNAPEKITLKVQTLERTAGAYDSAAIEARNKVNAVYRKYVEAESRQLDKDAATMRKDAEKMEPKLRRSSTSSNSSKASATCRTSAVALTSTEGAHTAPLLMPRGRRRAKISKAVPLVLRNRRSWCAMFSQLALPATTQDSRCLDTSRCRRSPRRQSTLVRCDEARHAELAVVGTPVRRHQLPRSPVRACG